MLVLGAFPLQDYKACILEEMPLCLQLEPNEQ